MTYSNALSTRSFNNEVFGELTTITNQEDNSIWFVGKEVAEMLGYVDTAQAIKTHCKRMKVIKNVDITFLDIPSRGLQIIPEGDIYRLATKSTKPEAEKFEEWVMEDVLPTIRQTGSYSIQQDKDMQIFQSMTSEQMGLVVKQKQEAEERETQLMLEVEKAEMKAYAAEIAADEQEDIANAWLDESLQNLTTDQVNLGNAVDANRSSEEIGKDYFACSAVTFNRKAVEAKLLIPRKNATGYWITPLARYKGFAKNTRKGYPEWHISVSTYEPLKALFV